ncbi:hypothetical protein BJX68DRAFT_224355 [Aspergillus pseudodeflectus]|uniref:Uncharacterized protein n=1 Tax=Aspergillus pseudodeflectus TaxID=176178 RepID=A0ABR4L6L8_9EURO
MIHSSKDELGTNIDISTDPSQHIASKRQPRADESYETRNISGSPHTTSTSYGLPTPTKQAQQSRQRLLTQGISRAFLKFPEREQIAQTRCWDSGNTLHISIFLVRRHAHHLWTGKTNRLVGDRCIDFPGSLRQYWFLLSFQSLSRWWLRWVREPERAGWRGLLSATERGG